ncbi:hypothetical protein H7849_03620 [Alloacidobacterium dinghuense]|uniref:Uncharacterized protein n=1 Tax=Alloacidobacterium dinghuense TaxID=2763107 RepID=A0A7G8BKK8_9BACT|nr:hypothetical protein [Alloacidobacterium dinghuense]QNI33078.1 hypothetical protein H7849_03620 [Alloacidobacterium dinghuense]
MTTAIDATVLAALENRNVWSTEGRAVSRRGFFAVRADELARHLKMNRDAVAESLSRLAATGKVMNIGGTAEDPSPRYHFVYS